MTMAQKLQDEMKARFPEALHAYIQAWYEDPDWDLAHRGGDDTPEAKLVEQYGAELELFQQTCERHWQQAFEQSMREKAEEAQMDVQAYKVWRVEHDRMESATRAVSRLLKHYLSVAGVNVRDGDVAQELDGIGDLLADAMRHAASAAVVEARGRDLFRKAQRQKQPFGLS